MMSTSDYQYVLSLLNPYITCSLCSGYYRHCYTILDCLHSFCYICLKKHFNKTYADKTNKTNRYKICPLYNQCNTKFYTDPIRLHCKYDFGLQSIVDSLIIDDITKQDNTLKNSIKNSLTQKYQHLIQQQQIYHNNINNSNKVLGKRKSIKLTIAEVYIELKPITDVVNNKTTRQIPYPLVRVTEMCPVQHIKKLIIMQLTQQHNNHNNNNINNSSKTDGFITDSSSSYNVHNNNNNNHPQPIINNDSKSGVLNGNTNDYNNNNNDLLNDEPSIKTMHIDLTVHKIDTITKVYTKPHNIELDIDNTVRSYKIHIIKITDTINNTVNIYVDADDLGCIIDRKSNLHKFYDQFNSPDELVKLIVHNTNDNNNDEKYVVLTHQGLLSFLQLNRVGYNQHYREWIENELLHTIQQMSVNTTLNNADTIKQQPNISMDTANSNNNHTQHNRNNINDNTHARKSADNAAHNNSTSLNTVTADNITLKCNNQTLQDHQLLHHVVNDIWPFEANTHCIIYYDIK